MWTLLSLPCAVGLVCCAVTPAVAQAPAIDVKTGLWEMSLNRSMSGIPQPARPVRQIPPEVLARMPPAQRAQIEAAMRGQPPGSSGTTVSRVCITREALQKGPALGREGRPSCKRTVRTQSRTAWEIQEVCNEEGRQETVRVRYEAPKPDTINATVDVTATRNGRQISVKRVMNGRWISADCAGVAPR
jgi:hypothetical protein